MKRVPDNVPVMPISFILQKCWLNHGLIQCLLNHMEWIDLSWCDLDPHELTRNHCDSKL